MRGTTRIELSGDFDCYNAPTIRERLFEIVESGDSDILLCLNAVDYVDSTALTALVAIHQRIIAHGGSFRIICTNRQVWRIFEITGLHRAFPIYRDEAALMASLGVK